MSTPVSGAPRSGAGEGMRSSRGATEQQERIPRLASDWNSTDCSSLSPAEGFLLSRIDGQTPWTILRQIGGISPEEVDRCLERWFSEGILEVGGRETASATESQAEGADAPDVDAALDLSEELQRKILDVDSNLASTGYFELLGVERDAGVKEIKRAYFRLSKEFHPDRYFRRDIGTYAVRLDRIFKKVVEAYELLSDPTTRNEIERSMPAEVAPAAGAYSGGRGAKERIGPEGAGRRRGGYRKPTRMQNLERLRQRFKIPKKVLAERQFRARQFYQAARVSAHEKSWLEAAASARLAIAFDPWNAEYKQGFAEIQSHVHRVRAADLLEQAADAGAKEEAFRLLEEALHYCPSDPEANARAARLALDLKDLDKALDYAENATELEPEVVGHALTLHRVYLRQGQKQEALVELARAAKLDPHDAEVRAAQRDLRRRSRR
jgi:curved DNA-binding protein CbpA